MQRTDIELAGSFTATVNAETFGGGKPWQAPQAIPLTRFAKVSAYLDF